MLGSGHLRGAGQPLVRPLTRPLAPPPPTHHPPLQPDEHITLHFSCLQNGVNKPGGYKTEHDFGEMMYNNAMSCTRHYSWHMWYQQ